MTDAKVWVNCLSSTNTHRQFGYFSQSRYIHTPQDQFLGVFDLHKDVPLSNSAKTIRGSINVSHAWNEHRYQKNAERRFI